MVFPWIRWYQNHIFQSMIDKNCVFNPHTMLMWWGGRACRNAGTSQRERLASNTPHNVSLLRNIATCFHCVCLSPCLFSFFIRPTISFLSRCNILTYSWDSPFPGAQCRISSYLSTKTISLVVSSFSFLKCDISEGTGIQCKILNFVFHYQHL